MTQPIDVIDVTSYGATGNGTTDDTAAIQKAVAAVIASAKMVNDIPNTVTKALYFPAGQYLVTKQDTLMFSPTNGTAQILYGLEIFGAGKHQSVILFNSTTGATTDPRQGNLMTCANRIRGARIHDLGIHSGNANQSFAYLWCSANNDGTYPGYGSGAQNDITWENLWLTGNWMRGWGFDGDSNANQNSEQVFRKIYVDASVTFGDAGVKSGFAPFHPQQCQFLNHAYYDCEIEYMGGVFLDYEMGGSVNIIGGSWILCGTAPSVFIALGAADIADGTWRLMVQGVRFELRDQSHKVIHANWVRGNITFISCSDDALAFEIKANEITPGAYPNFGNVSPQTHVYNWANTWGGGPIVRYLDCQLMGYHQVYTDTTAVQAGKVIYDGCRFATEPQATFLRSTNAAAPSEFMNIGA